MRSILHIEASELDPMLGVMPLEEGRGMVGASCQQSTYGNQKGKRTSLVPGAFPEPGLPKNGGFPLTGNLGSVPYMSWNLTGLAILASSMLLPTVQDDRGAGAGETPSYRRTTIGRTLLPNGKAWSGAEVFFLHRPLPEHPDVGQSDLIRVESSAKGRFRVELLEGRSYMVWARSRDEKGRNWVSEVHATVMARQPIRILRSKRPSMPERILLDGWEQAEKKAESYRVSFGPMHQWLPVSAGKTKASLVVPPTPYVSSILQALDAKGRVLHELPIARRSLPLFPLRWKYASLRRVPIEILSGKKPVAGAEVRVRTRWDHPLGARKDLVGSLLDRGSSGVWTTIGRSDAQGRCHLMVPRSAFESGKLYIQVLAPGMQEKFVCVQPKFIKKPGDHRATKTTIQLEAGQRLKGRLLLGADKPLARQALLIQRKTEYAVNPKRKQRVSIPGEIVLTAEDGSFAFSFVDRTSDYRILMALDPGVWTRLSPAYNDLPLPAPQAVLYSSYGRAASSTGPGELRLDRLVAVDVHVPAVKDPAAVLPVLLLADERQKVSGGSIDPAALIRSVAPRGRTTFLMADGSFETLLVHPEIGSCQETLKLESSNRGKIHRWDAPLKPFVSLGVKVRSSHGKPIPEVPLETMGGGYTHLSRLCAEIYRYNTRAIESAVTDDKGNTTLHLLPVAQQTYDIMIGWRVATKMGVSVTPVRVSSDSYPESIEIEVGK